MVGILIEGGLPHVILVHPAIPGLHLVIELTPAAVTMIPLLLNEGNIQGIVLWPPNYNSF